MIDAINSEVTVLTTDETESRELAVRLKMARPMTRKAAQGPEEEEKPGITGEGKVDGAPGGGGSPTT